MGGKKRSAKRCRREAASAVVASHGLHSRDLHMCSTAKPGAMHGISKTLTFSGADVPTYASTARS